ncbi:hypothetical protein ACEPPN_002326 [Leptodophora sp. 'Broadleaf-Isolate-01']
MTSNFQPTSTPPPPSATSQDGPGHGAAFELPVIDSSDDELPVLSFKLSALTNALLDSENSQEQSTRPTSLSSNCISDAAERQSKSASPILPWQSRSSNETGYGLPEWDSGRLMRIVRIKSRASRIQETSSPGESNRGPNLPRIWRAQSDGSISGKLVTPSPRLYKSKIEAATLESSGSRSRGTGTLGSGGEFSLNTAGGVVVHTVSKTGVERLTRSEDGPLRRGTSSVLRSTKTVGTSLRGPARRFKRRACDEPSPGDEIIYSADIGGLEVPEPQSESRDEAPHVDVIEQSQPQVMALKCHDTMESDVHNLENPNAVLYTRNNIRRFVDMNSPSKSSSAHQRGPSSLPPERDKENNQPPMAFRDGKSVNNHLDNCDNPREKQDATPGFLSSQRKALGVLGVNNPHRPPPPPKMSVLQMATKAAGAATTSSQRKKKVHITINNNAYQRLECIGRGGSCRVYRVMSENFKIWALKKVSLADVDEQAVRGFKGEIDLLRKLSKVDRVVQLRDWEVNEAKQTLSVLMEFGEVDLDTILKRRIHTEHPTFDAGFTLFHWKEMLECVAAVHQHDVVHSDLKPANFLLVKGSLKLIDFGIANVIQDDTINVHREHQVGTPNFMAPEALSFARADTAQPVGAGKLVKLGKPSDIWSLGCILYLMVYGEVPFAQCRGNLQKAVLITNPNHVITYPSTGIGGVCVPSGFIKTLKACLTFDQFQRPDIEALLSESSQLLYPSLETEGKVSISQEHLGAILESVVRHCRESGLPTDPEVASWQRHFYDKIKLAGAN